MLALLRIVSLLVFLPWYSAHAAEPVLLTKFIAGRDAEEVTSNLKAAFTSHNYTFVRVQEIESQLVPADWKARSVRIVYFCNFDKLNAALLRDSRTTQVMPCRITLIEGQSGVDLIAVNPGWVSEQWNAPELHQQCLLMKRDYLSILEEAAI